MPIDLSGYVDVAERVREFYAKYPDGSLQSEIVEMTDTRVTVKAWAYRTPDDPRPAIGHSWLAIPGSTSFTRGSEIENAETSAWGRALAGLGFATKQIASRDEVQNHQGPEFPDKEIANAHTFVKAACEKYGILEPDVFRILGVPDGNAMIALALSTDGAWITLAETMRTKQAEPAGARR